MPDQDSNTRLIPLTQGKFAVVDSADFEWLNRWTWHAYRQPGRSTWYAVTSTWDSLTKKKGTLFMHRMILGPIDPKVYGEHRDNDGLNNRRSNLRPSTHAQNLCNCGPRKHSVSGVKGVRAYGKKWQAQISFHGKTIYLGRFVNITDAANAYAEAATKMYGEFARTKW